MTSPDESSADSVSKATAVPDRPRFWSRHSTIINFWLDVLLLILFLIQAWMFAVLHAVFPRGAGSDWTIWGATPLDWSEALFTTFCVFSFAIVVHVMFHWSWICGVVATRLLGRKAGKDDGTQTLIGVGVIVVLVHLLVGGILLAKVALTAPT
ncbi:MAG: hypothetical protein JSS49_24655 [Planctomycetes bacterium]|nr:hypothetical protein [Planctomycetota bacterium]